MRALGHDVNLNLTLDDVLQLGLKELNTIEIDEGLSVVTREYVGQEATRSHGTNGPAVITASWDLDRKDAARLIDAQRNANRPNALKQAISIGLTAGVDYGAEGRSRRSYPNCILSNARTSMTGRVEVVRFSGTFTCDAPETIG